jgi:SAM-dependent methyltransferase
MNYQGLVLPSGEVLPGERDVSPRLALYRKEDFLGRMVLDLGCNCGVDCIWAVKEGAAFAAGIDTNPDAIFEAMWLADAWGFWGKTVFICGDAATEVGRRNKGLPVVLLANSVAKWIGVNEIASVAKSVLPVVVYLESHSENDEWTNSLILKLSEYDFSILGMLPYTKEDPRPIRRFFRGTFRAIAR